MGESLFELEQYEKALIQFNEVLKSRGYHKHDDAMLMKGQTLLLMGRKDEAYQVFYNLVKNYPDSEYLPRARNYMDQIK